MDIGASFNKAFEEFKKYPVELIVGFVVMGILSAIITSVFNVVPKVGPLLGVLVGFGIRGLFLGGAWLMAGKTVSGIKPEINDAFVPFQQRQVDYVLAGAVFSLGGILCGVGAIPFMFALLIVAEGADWQTAVKRSMDLVFANVGDCLMMVLVFLGCMIASIVTCGIGALVLMPVTGLMVADLYVQLKNKALQQANPPMY